jgi:hypothetical protein
MTNGVAIVVVIERRAQELELHGMKATEVTRELRRIRVDSGGHRTLTAVAGGENQSFVKNPRERSSSATCESLLVGERHSFAHLNGRRAVIQSTSTISMALIACSLTSGSGFVNRLPYQGLSVQALKP